MRVEAARILAEDVGGGRRHAVALIVETSAWFLPFDVVHARERAGSADSMVEVSVSVRSAAFPCAWLGGVGVDVSSSASAPRASGLRWVRRRVRILMCAGCALVCLLLFVTMALTQVAMQDGAWSRARMRPAPGWAASASSVPGGADLEARTGQGSLSR